MKTTHTTPDDEGSKRMATYGGRTMVMILIVVMGFTGLGIHIATAEAPNKQALIVMNKGAESYFVAHSQKLLTQDQRAQHIRDYFARWDLPAGDYADQFVVYADIYSIDWRLAAAIAMRETTGCDYTIKHHAITSRQLNCFGWGNADFDSIEQGIALVTRNLAGENPNTAYFYAGKDLRGKLYSYNSVIPDYYDDITRIMDDIFNQVEFFQKIALTPNV